MGKVFDVFSLTITIQGSTKYWRDIRAQFYTTHNQNNKKNYSYKLLKSLRMIGGAIFLWKFDIY